MDTNNKQHLTTTGNIGVGGRPNTVHHQHHHAHKNVNFKLLSDPFITKGAPKLYRYNGIVPDDHLSPAVQVRDPRSQLTRIWTRLEVLEIPLPKFKVII
jgi:histone-lysine N-methyltransferase SETD1